MWIKRKVCSYYLGRKVVFRKWIFVVSVVSGLVVILFSVRNVRGGFIVIVSDVPRQASLLSCQYVFVCRTCLDHNCSVEEKLEFKRCEDVLEEVEKFCYLGDMISCYCGASEAVSTRIGIAWNKFRGLSCVLVRKQGLSLKQWGNIYLLLC